MNTADEFLESLIAATLNGEVKWDQGTEQLGEVMEEIYGNFDALYSFLDDEAGANVVLASYKYYEGEVEADEFIKDGVSILLVDDEDFEVLNEITDEDVEDAALFEKLMASIKMN